MHRTASRTLALAASIAFPHLIACGGGTSPGGTGAGSGNGGHGVASSGSAGLGGSTGAGHGGNGVASSGSAGLGGAGTASTGSTSSGTGGGVARACPAAADVISDFEEDLPAVEPPFEKGKGAWYSYNDATAGGTQTLTVETKSPTAMCDMYDLHVSAAGYPMYSGFGVSFSSATPKAPESFSAYTGFQYDIKADGTTDPMWVEVLTTENQPASGGGTATHASVDEYNTSGSLKSTTATTYTTVYVPFGILGPRYLPSGCAAGVFCEAPAFDPTSVLGLQFSVVNQFPPAGQYNVAVDNVLVMTSTTNGLAAAPTTAGAAHPFPVDGAVGTCTKPTGATGKFLTDAYAKWKARFVVAAGNNLRVQRPENGNDSVSEGIGYGMLIAANVNDQALFNSLWGYWKANVVGGTTLMNWDIPPGNNGSATDADEDAAFALLLASKQWGGGSATNTYLTAAKAMIADIWTHDVDKGATGGPMINGGSQFSGRVNPSYFAPAYYLAFSKVDTNAADNWTGLITNVYAYLKAITNSVAPSGLVPAWCQNGCTAAGNGPTGAATESEYQYDAHRVPWRIGLDACWNGTAGAKTYVALVAGTNGFFQTNSATAGLGSLGDIYMTNGTKDATNSKANSMSLIGTMGVGAMAAGNTALALRAYRFVLDASYSPDPVGAVAAYTYFNATVGLMSALTLSGNFMTYP